MRKITEQAAAAFMAGRNWKSGNTRTECEADVTTMYLHDNAIARLHHAGPYVGQIQVTLAGWPTVTTRERLNGIPGVDVYQRNHEQYINGEPMPTSEWVEVG